MRYFKPVSSRVNFPELERRILGFWLENKIFERSVEQRQGGPLYVIYDGPPTANASPGIHHVLARVFKDLFPRYKAMKGYYVPRRAGWDTHGLPVELAVENELGLKSKREIEEYGIAEFNKRCRQNVLRYVKEWEDLTDRIGFWIDMKHPYITFENGYIETCWWIINQLWRKGLIYQGYKVTPHCPRCGTSLSSHEVALGYDDTDDPSIYIKFEVAKSLYKKPGFLDQMRSHSPPVRPLLREADFARRLLELVEDKQVYLLAWTTTPWTLPGNTALAVAADSEYSIMESKDDYLIMASALVDKVGPEGYLEKTRVTGGELVGLLYEPLFNPLDYGITGRKMATECEGLGQREAREPSEAWGPGWFGGKYQVIKADFVSMEEGTGIVHVAPSFGEVDYQAGEDNGLDFVRDYVDLQGIIQGSYPFAGKFVKDADPLILDDLKSRGLLFRSERIRHTYPFCWRCNTPLLYYAKPSWYIKTTAMKDRLISGNAEINWYPEYIKYGRFGDWLNNNVDWAFSRERYWGTPLPIWRCQSCNYEECIGSVEELKKKPGVKGADELSDLHRPYIDEVTYSCSKCGKEMRRVPEVIDCWFDSGAMPFAQWHYPFENEAVFKDWFPADFICEAVDQTRGWFYSLHAISTLVMEQPCFKNVICLGHILDAAGEKMSKSKGNVVKPEDVLAASGADAVRWYMYTSSPPGNVRRFSKDLVDEVVRKFMLTLWNTCSFFVTYANIDKFVPGTVTFSGQRPELDRWMLSELNLLVNDVTRSLEEYDPTAAGRRIEEFVDNLSNWYVRRSRRRFWKSENDADKLSAYTTLYHCLVTLAKLLAPFTPFVSEELYQNLVRPFDKNAPDSVHLTDYPVADLSQVDEKLSAATNLVMKVTSLGRAARAKAGVKVRQPLAKVLVKVRTEAEKVSLERMSSQVLDELNIKELKVVEILPSGEHSNWPLIEESGLAVMVDADINQELADEGLTRELVHRLQNLRKQAGFDIADYIETYYEGGPAVQRVMEKFEQYIKQETLSRKLVEGKPPEGAFGKSQVIDGEKVTLAVKKLGS
ncbi:MAG: isoleucine--tRNA ligase [Chloroflexi bacterium RBG_13_52_14]|nr:MAG: isoleucine--tRNA ligase [Chloroflexi bacterium RBG_13_52_14]